MKVPSKKREAIKKDLFKKCKCLGSGCSSCLKQGQMIDKLGESNIPTIYWFLKMRDFTGPSNVKEETVKYKEDLESKYLTGSGICYVGSYGAGKSTAICSILKTALMSDYTVYYTSLVDLINNLTDYSTKNEFFNLVSKVDFLAIDEIDSRHFSDSPEAHSVFGSSFERVVRYRTQNQLPLITASNNSSIEEVFSGQWKRVVDSLLSSTNVVPVIGKDHRKMGSK